MADLVDDTADDTDTDSDFNAGYAEQTAPAKDPKPEGSKEDGTALAATKPEPAPAPEYIQITKSDWDRVTAAADKTAGIEGQLAKVFGTVGNVKQIVDQLKAATPQGVAIEMPADLLSELEEEYPELAPRLKGVFEKAFKGIRGTAPAAAQIDPEAIGKAVTDRYVKAEAEALDDAHSDWREIVGAVSDGNYDANHPFRKWLATQAADYQTKVNTTNSSAVISRAIDRFKAANPASAPKQPAPKDTARQDRIRAALTPKGDGGQPGGAKTADDYFNEGFAGG